MKPNLKFAETFVGCGGSHIGLKNIGFEDVFVNDNNKTLAKRPKCDNISMFFIIYLYSIQIVSNVNTQCC